MFALLLLLLIDLYILMNTGSSSAGAAVVVSGQWTVLGSMGCGWTRKQLEYMKRKGIPHVYKDCAGGKCAGVEAFPTLISPNGEKTTGYSEM